MEWTVATKAVFCLVVFLQLSCHHQSMVSAAAAASRQRRSVDQYLTITADHKMRLFIDGIEEIDLDHPNSANHADTVLLPASSQVVAVSAKNAGNNGGVLGSADTFVTDASWKCTDQFYEGWEGVAFNDSDWDAAFVVGPHGMKPWQEVEGISANASWIWITPKVSRSNKEDEKDVYCRRNLESRGTLTEPKTSLLLMLLAFLLLKN